MRGTRTFGTIAAVVAACGATAGCGGSSDDSASTSTATPVAAKPALPAGLQGTWSRYVTKADIERTARIRNEAGPEQDTPKPHAHRLVITPSDLQDSDLKANVVVDEDFKAMPDGTLAILGYQHPERGAACGPDIPQNATYAWKVTGDKLVLHATKDPCADRDSALSGTWKRG